MQPFKSARGLDAKVALVLLLLLALINCVYAQESTFVCNNLCFKANDGVCDVSVHNSSNWPAYD